MDKLFVCQTCRRDERLAPDSISRGAELTAALEAALADHPIASLGLVKVACLNGCLNPCNVSLRGPKKYAIRLSQLGADDAQPLVALAAAYVATQDGVVHASEWPDTLQARVSANVPPPHLLLRGQD